MTKPDHEIEQFILDCLRRNEDGLCIAEVARYVHTQRTTATKHLNRLRDKGLVHEISRPRIRLFFISEV